MKKEEVIKWLKIMKANLNTFPEVSSEKKIEALAEAIRLFKNEQSEEPSSSEKPNKSEIPTGSDIRSKGHWIDHSDEGYVECPICGSATNCDDNINDLHFCFSCGAEMRGEEE